MSEDTLRTHPGSALAAAREERKLTQRDVADVLNLSVAVVEAIETGDQQHLPASVFTQGYIRAYAKLVDLDPEPLVANLDTAEPEVVPEKSPATINPLPIQLPPAALGGGAIVLVLLLVWVVWPASEEPTVTEIEQMQETSVAEAFAEEPAVEPAPDLAALQSAMPVATDEPESLGAVEEDVAREEIAEEEIAEEGMAVEGIAEGVEAESFLEVSSEVISTLREGYLPLTGAGFQLLDIDFTEECWVEIKNSDGATLFADLGRPGRTFRFQGEGPFHVLLGYAPGALIRFNEEPVVLSPHTRNNVASVVLGQ